MEPTGTNGIGNGNRGIYVDSSSSMTVIGGGTTRQVRVVVSGNGYLGGDPGIGMFDPFHWSPCTSARGERAHECVLQFLMGRISLLQTRWWVLIGLGWTG